MTAKINLEHAIKESIQTEKDAMDFYLLCADRSHEEKAERVFKLLASEERDHAHQFYRIYPGQDLPAFEELIKAPINAASVWLKELKTLTMGDFDERRALELAIDKELELEQHLRAMAAAIDDSEVKKVYLSNASSTHHHKELIENEYRDIYGG